MKDYPTPQTEQSRPSDLANHRSKESQLKKSQKKNLNAAFRTISLDSSPEISKDLVDFSPISEIWAAVFNGDIELALNPTLSDPSESFYFADLTPSSTSTIAGNKSEVSDLSPTHHQFTKSNVPNIGSLEADVLANLLKEARSQVLNAINVDTKFNKLLDSLINFVVDEFYTIPEDRDRFNVIVSMKFHIVMTCLLIWILALSLIFFFASEP